jgi:CO/xanthine dehydrogenase Mo-binding subunit
MAGRGRTGGRTGLVTDTTGGTAATGSIGVPRPRPDSEPKVRGTVRYAADRRRLGTLHARPVLATYAHARIAGIDV